MYDTTTIPTDHFIEDPMGMCSGGDVGGDIQIGESFNRRFAMKLDNDEFCIVEFTTYVASEDEDRFNAEHGPVPATWFGRGTWPTCQCGFAPRDNTKLNEHWAEHNFKVVDDHGQLVKHFLDAWVQTQVYYAHCTDPNDVGSTESHADYRYWNGTGQGMTTDNEARDLVSKLTVEDLNEAVNQMGV